jgi:hypothetical protein
MPTEDLTSDLNSDTDNYKKKSNSNGATKRDNLQFNFQQKTHQKPTANKSHKQQSDSDDEIKTPDIDIDFAFQVNI